MTDIELARYEVEGSWWAPHVSWEWAQRIAGRYFAAKVRRKLGRAARARVRLAVAHAILDRAP